MPVPVVQALAGPTGVGKTALALLLSARLDLEVVSVDSRQVYRLMDIGTAKPTPSERAAVEHHLIDVADPGETYSAGRFVREASAAIAGIRARGRTPLLVGGTGLYLKALAEGLLNAPPSDPRIRAALREEAAEAGTDALYARLCAADPEAAAKIGPRDLLRLVRALEIVACGARPSALARQQRRKALHLDIFVLEMPREALYRRLDERVARMAAEGLVEEVRRLLDLGYDEGLRSMQGIGYREFASFVRGRCTLAEAVEATRKATRNFAKRQMTWFRGVPGARRIALPESGDLREAERMLLEAARSGPGG